MSSRSDKVNLHPFAAAIIHHLKDEEVEIYCGDVRTTRLFADYERMQKNVLRGIIREAMGDCLILECSRKNATTSVFVNVWGIKCIIKIKDNLFVSDVFEDEEVLVNQRRR